MYPVRLGYEVAVKRINSLIVNGHYAEAFVTSVFTIEKTLRRTLRQIIVSAGFKSRITDKIINRINGLHNLIEAWEIYEPKHRKLNEIINREHINFIREVGSKRNKLIHGNNVFNKETYKEQTIKILKILDEVKLKLDSQYGYSGWEKVQSRKVSKLHTDPKIKID